MKTILWGNYKGGVGKTTSVYQVATFFAQEGKKVLLIDLDPQCSLSNICCNANGDNLSDYKIDNVLNYLIELYSRYINSKNDFDFSLLAGKINDCISNIVEKSFIEIEKFKNHLYFIPSSISFENCRLNELAQRMWENIHNIFLFHLLITDIKNSEPKFDYVFIDCPPTSNILIQSAFLESDYYIIPTIIDEISANGVTDYISEIEKTRRKYTMNDAIGSILIEKVFCEKTKLIGIFETLYKNRNGNSAKQEMISSLDDNINKIPNMKSLISNDKFNEYRHNNTKNIFDYCIYHKDSRSTGDSVPQNTSQGVSNELYKNISDAIIDILEN